MSIDSSRRFKFMKVNNNSYQAKRHAHLRAAGPGAGKTV
jgi:hypothetical protein